MQVDAAPNTPAAVAVPGPLVGTGATAEVFAYGKGVLKLYLAGVPRAAVEREAAILELLQRAGVPAPRSGGLVEIDGRWGLTMTRAPGEPFATAMLADAALVPRYLDAMAALQRRLHAAPGGALPRLKTRLGERIAGAEALGATRRGELLRRLDQLPDGDRLCHGDFHPYNVLGPPDRAVIIDWVDAASGPPPADLARSYVLMVPRLPEVANAYLERYLATAGGARGDVEAWTPVVAAARLTENIADADTETLLRLAG